MCRTSFALIAGPKEVAVDGEVGASEDPEEPEKGMRCMEWRCCCLASDDGLCGAD